MHRRSFVKTTSAAIASLGTANAAGPFVRPEGARLRIGLAAYSFRNYFHVSRGRPSSLPEDQQIGMKQFIDFCAANGCDGAELTSYFFDENVSEEELIEVRRHAFLRGVDISGTAVGNNFTHPEGELQAEQMAYVKTWIDRAATLGAPHIRVFAGKHGKELAEEEAWSNVVKNLRVAGDYAATKGIFLGIENHDSVGDHETLLNLVREANHPWIGVNLDSGNFRTEDPYVDIEKSAPFAVNVQVKVEFKRAGSDEKEPTDLDRLMGILKDANYQGYVILEYEEDDNPYEKIPPVLEKLRELAA